MLFISYSTKDRMEAAKLRAVLINKGYDPKQIFLDSDEQSGIEAGTMWEQVLYERLKDCRAFVVLCSPNWKESRWCFAELVYARMSGKEIFPVVIAEGDIGGIASEHQAVFVTRDGDRAYNRLFAALDARHLGPRDHLPWPHPDVKDDAGNVDNCPFPGLFAFDERYAAVYFGREPEINTLLQQFNEMRRKGEPRLLMIVGGSGSGKSSLLKAGVLPRLKHKNAGGDWLVLPILRFGDLAHGENAFFQALAENIVSEYPVNAATVPNCKTLRDQFANPNVQQAVDGLWEAVHDLAIASGSKDVTMLLPVDQFEELLAPTSGAMANRFLNFLKVVCERPNPRFLIVGTMRSDYLDLYEHHSSSLKSPLFLPWRLEPFPRERLADVIVKPAERVHVHVDGDLLEKLKQDTPTADALPLLAFTLRELYKKCATDRRLLLTEYVERGGMEGSIKKTVETIVPNGSLPNEVMAGVRLSFVKRLAQVNEKDEFVRRTANWNDIDEAARPILSRFVAARLLVKSEHGGQEQVEIAHEAMLRCWDVLNDWLRTSADILRWRRDVGRDQESDTRNGKRWNGLRSAQLEVAREWPTHRRNELTDSELEWIWQGVWRQRGLRCAAGLVVLVFAFLAGFAWRQMGKANEAQASAITSLETQLKMFTKPTQLAGAIAAAVSAREPGEVKKALDELTKNEILMATTPNIKARIGYLEATVSGWNPNEKREWGKEPKSEAVRQAALSLAKAVRTGWETQMLEDNARSMTRDIIVKPTYDRAIAVTQKISRGLPKFANIADIKEFEKLYWGELVFLETRDVEEKMVAFRKTLLDPKFQENSLKSNAIELRRVCDEALKQPQKEK